MSSDYSDTSSVCSDLSNISLTSHIELVETEDDEEESEDKNFADNEDFRQSSYLFDTDDVESPMLMICKNLFNSKL